MLIHNRKGFVMQEKTRNYSFVIEYEGRQDDIKTESMAQAIALAEEYIRGGDYSTDDGSVYVSYHVEETAPPHEREGNTIVINPVAPDCSDGGGHDWRAGGGGAAENPGVHSHGGGVIIREICSHCGVIRITDTWASSPETGQDGFTTVAYT